MPTKINQLLQLAPSGVVLASKWLRRNGYSPELIRNYKKSKWLKTLGNGAVIRYKDDVDYLGAVYAMQDQLGMSIHPSARTALGLLGRAHYLELNQKQVYLFGSKEESLPSWFKKNDWEYKIAFFTSDFLPSDIGMTTVRHKNFDVQVASPARALMECLYLTPKYHELIECYEIMKGLPSISPLSTQVLLENCRSVKVKRLFLYLAEKADHNWFSHLEINKIQLGEGKRSFAKNGKFINKYMMSVPSELTENELPEV